MGIAVRGADVLLIKNRYLEHDGPKPMCFYTFLAVCLMTIGLRAHPPSGLIPPSVIPRSSLVGCAKGPRRIDANISGEESFAVTVTMHCINPCSASSVIANRSLCCLFHHSLDSGISDGCAVPKSRTIGSGSLADEAPFRPAARLRLFLKNNSVCIRRFRNQKPQSEDLLNQLCSNINLLRAWC